ncbi:Planctomycete cytochrome C (fragment) [Verrucomicrobia bacterium]
MQARVTTWAAALWLGNCLVLQAGLTPEQAAQMPPPAIQPVNFSKEIKPIFQASCIQCHGHGKDKGGFRLDSRETVIKGGDSGPAIVVGKSLDSRLIALVQGADPDEVMPKKGSRLSPQQIGLLRAWIDQGAPWDAGVTFGRVEPINLKPRLPPIPRGSKSANPIDRFLTPYFAAHHIKPPRPVDDRLFARRVYLDILGVLPPPGELAAFETAGHADKRARLVRRLLADDRNYAEHWLSFWNDLLRNDYKGTGYIDGGREQITKWLYSALCTNMPYDQFVAQLVNPSPQSAGFIKGIVWRGVVNASQTPQMQVAQNICQVFMGVNLKCASCHDSFVNDLTLADAYGLAGIYSDGPLEMVRCDKPTGQKAALKFIYPELGAVDPAADQPTRLKRLAELITQRPDARLTRTLVNRLWQKLLGRGLVEPVDDMEKPAWDPDLLDWLAEDFAEHGYDVKHLIERLVTSRAYQLPAVPEPEQTRTDYVFRGPSVRRLTAEQFRDALTRLTGIGYSAPAFELGAGTSSLESVAGSPPGKATPPAKSPISQATNQVRASLVVADPLLTALGRPDREQVVTTRSAEATTLQALELTNGETLAEVLKHGARKLLARQEIGSAQLISGLYEQAFGRKPSAGELQTALELIGQPAKAEGVEDFLWCLAMLPEFQMIY